jgi:hypothetical protein
MLAQLLHDVVILRNTSMPQVYELFGFPVNNRSFDVERSRKAGLCPFMQFRCDGGGNRHQTRIRLQPGDALSTYFESGIESIIPGICSINAGDDTWVVCPRRLFAARNSHETVPVANEGLQAHEAAVLLQAGFQRGETIGIWSEVSLKQQSEESEFNYHFDFVIMPLITTTLLSFLDQFNLTGTMKDQEIRRFASQMRKCGYYTSNIKDIANTAARFPQIEHPLIFEVMTASTSGSDTTHETDIRGAFRNAILNREYESPSINKRQVWGRMVTQLFAKTALAQAWGGQTLWIIQDELLRNIELTTLLKTPTLRRRPGSEINLIVMQYTDTLDGYKTITLKEALTGDSGLDFGGDDTFTDILLPKIVPAKLEFVRAVLRRSIDAVVQL